MDLVLLGTDKDFFHKSKGDGYMAVAQIAREKVKAKTKKIHPKDGEQIELALKEKNKKSDHHSGAKTISYGGHG